MELSILEDKKNRIVVEIKGETHSFCNAIKKELWNDKHVKTSAYDINHPFVGVPKLIVETDSNETPKKALIAASKRLEKNLDKFKTDFSKLK